MSYLDLLRALLSALLLMKFLTSRHQMCWQLVPYLSQKGAGRRLITKQEIQRILWLCGRNHNWLLLRLLSLLLSLFLCRRRPHPDVIHEVFLGVAFVFVGLRKDLALVYILR